MARLMMSPDKLRNNAEELKQVTAQLKDVLAQIERINLQIDEAWLEEGNLWKNKMEQCKNISVEELIHLCNDYACYMECVAQKFEETEMNLFHSFIGDVI